MGTGAGLYANEMAQEARAELWEGGEASSTERLFDLKEDFAGSK